MEMMTNAAYYTLSTISQTLVGGFAFLAAAALYRMTILQTVTLPNLSKRAEARQSEIQSVAASGKPTPKYLADILDEINQGFQYVDDTIKAMVKVIRYALWWTAGTIIACLIVMPFVPFFTASTKGALFWTLVAVVTSAVYTIKTLCVSLLKVISP